MVSLTPPGRCQTSTVLNPTSQGPFARHGVLNASFQTFEVLSSPAIRSRCSSMSDRRKSLAAPLSRLEGNEIQQGPPKRSRKSIAGTNDARRKSVSFAEGHAAVKVVYYENGETREV